MTRNATAAGAAARFLSRTPVLWASFVATLVMSVGFLAIMHHWDFLLIDEMWQPDRVRAYVATMTPLQRSVHVWTTATLDVAYPLAYASLLAGLTHRGLGPARAWLLLPSALVVPVDLYEGYLQVQILTGDMSHLACKAWVTPLKLGLFGIALAIAAAGLIQMLRRRRRPA